MAGTCAHAPQHSDGLLTRQQGKGSVKTALDLQEPRPPPTRTLEQSRAATGGAGEREPGGRGRRTTEVPMALSPASAQTPTRSSGRPGPRSVTNLPPPPLPVASRSSPIRPARQLGNRAGQNTGRGQPLVRREQSGPANLKRGHSAGAASPRPLRRAAGRLLPGWDRTGRADTRLEAGPAGGRGLSGGPGLCPPRRSSPTSCRSRWGLPVGRSPPPRVRPGRRSTPPPPPPGPDLSPPPPPGTTCQPRFLVFRLRGRHAAAFPLGAHPYLAALRVALHPGAHPSAGCGPSQ